MPPTTPRRITVADGMILIAGLAIAMWASATGLVPWISTCLSIPAEIWRADPVRLALHWGSEILGHSQPIAAVLTLVVLLLRIPKPRPNLRRLVRQPGFTACAAASVAICIGGGLTYATTKARFVPGFAAQGYTYIALLRQASEPGIAVASCWILLALGKQWRFERTWIDRLGWILGGYWLIMIAVVRLTSQQ
jgi:hypothetical protein